MSCLLVLFLRQSFPPFFLSACPPHSTAFATTVLSVTCVKNLACIFLYFSTFSQTNIACTCVHTKGLFDFKIPRHSTRYTLPYGLLFPFNTSWNLLKSKGRLNLSMNNILWQEYYTSKYIFPFTLQAFTVFILLPKECSKNHLNTTYFLQNLMLSVL